LHDPNSVAGNDYDKAVAGVKMAEANLKHAKNQMNDTKLLAPVSGYIHEVNFNEGEMVDAGMPVASLIDVTGYEVEVNIPVSLSLQRETFTGFTGKQPTVSNEAFPLELTGYSKRAENNQLYAMHLKLDPGSNPELAPGMNVEVTINMKTGFKNKLCVPLNSVFEKNGESYVWVYLPDEGVVKSRQVTTGQLTGKNLITVVSGVEAGEQVVSAGVHQLQENQQVETVKPVSATNVGGML
jgi:RND family efflux transporter MFP subunit